MPEADNGGGGTPISPNPKHGTQATQLFLISLMASMPAAMACRRREACPSAQTRLPQDTGGAVLASDRKSVLSLLGGAGTRRKVHRRLNGGGCVGYHRRVFSFRRCTIHTGTFSEITVSKGVVKPMGK